MGRRGGGEREREGRRERVGERVVKWKGGGGGG